MIRVCSYGAPIPISVFWFYFSVPRRHRRVLLKKKMLFALRSLSPSHSNQCPPLMEHCMIVFFSFRDSTTFFFTLAVYVFHFHLTIPVCVLFSDRIASIECKRTHTSETRNTPTHMRDVYRLCARILCAQFVFIRMSRTKKKKLRPSPSRLDQR